MGSSRINTTAKPLHYITVSNSQFTPGNSLLQSGFTSHQPGFDWCVRAAREVFPMYAIVQSGGKQFRVAPGDVIRVPRIAGDVGSEVEFSRVLAVFKGEGEILAGADAGDSRIKGTITNHDRGKKVLVFKFKRKKQYKRTIGHRQDFTEV